MACPRGRNVTASRAGPRGRGGGLPVEALCQFLTFGPARRTLQVTPGATRICGPGGAPVSGFVQVIEWRTSRIDDVGKFIEDWRERYPEMGPSRVLECADRDHPGRYMTVVEFPSYEAAMTNNQDPATHEFAEGMLALCDSPPVFHNLDVINLEQREAGVLILPSVDAKNRHR